MSLLLVHFNYVHSNPKAVFLVWVLAEEVVCVLQMSGPMNVPG